MVPGRSRGWIWFFVILAGLAVTALTILVTFTLRQQLRPEQLAQARALWRQKGPADYDLSYTVEKQESDPEKFVVQVRHGRVMSVVEAAPGAGDFVTENGRPLEPRQFSYYSVPALFDFVDQFLKMDAEPGSPRTFTRAYFDPEDGHLVHYIRRVMGSRQRVEIDVHLRPAAAEPSYRDSSPKGTAETSESRHSGRS
ncbi:MAG: hypothetical protein JO112_17640 [Planctomycetes bacterium]|nr:hypothetical protein [Planctomycetota bacterium]